jgi:hypothetical protein
MRTYHDGYKNLEPVMLFNLTQDVHETHNLAAGQPERVDRAMRLLADWHHEQMVTSTQDVDPLMTVMREGGPYYIRKQLAQYLDRLRATGRGHHAETLASRHPNEL